MATRTATRTDTLASRLRQVRRNHRARRVAVDGSARELLIVAFALPLATLAVLFVALLATLLLAGADLGGLIGTLGATWLAVHQVPVSLSGVTIGALPLLPTLLIRGSDDLVTPQGEITAYEGGPHNDKKPNQNVADAVQAEHLAGHLEAGDLLAAVLAGDAGLEEAGAHGVERLEAVAGAEQRLAARHRATLLDQIVQPLELVVGHAHRQAQLAQVAARAGHLEGLGADCGGGLCGRGHGGGANVTG